MRSGIIITKQMEGRHACTECLNKRPDEISCVSFVDIMIKLGLPDCSFLNIVYVKGDKNDID